MNTTELRLRIRQALDRTDNPALLQAAFDLLALPQEEAEDWWADLSPAQQAQVKRGIGDLGQAYRVIYQCSTETVELVKLLKNHV